MLIFFPLHFKGVNIYTCSFILLLTILGCKQHDTKTLSTDLKLTVQFKIDVGGSLIDSTNAPGAKVVLFKSRIDMEARVRPVASGETDANGVLILKELEPFPYFVYAYYDNGTDYYDNSNGNYSLGDVLVEGALTIATVPIYYNRVSTPTQVVVDYMEIIKYDTLTPSGCSKYLRFSLEDLSYANIDVTYNAQHCPVQNYSTSYHYFSYVPIDITAYDNNSFLLFYLQESATNAGTYTYTSYPDYYKYYYIGKSLKNNNSNSNQTYPKRVRLWEDQHTVIDAILIWY